MSYAADKQTDKQTDSKILPTPTDIVGKYTVMVKVKVVDLYSASS